MIFDKNFEKIKNNLKNELCAIESKMVEKIKTKEPLQTSIVEFLSAPSKRIRSILSILYYKALYPKQNLNEQQIEFLSSIELIHSASLIHDDIIDESNLRRGLKTIHSQFNTKLGVITGDYIMALAIENLAKLGCADIISNTVQQMCQGEIEQNFSKFQIGTIEDYIKKSRNKTGLLFENAIYTTVLLGANTDFDSDICRKFSQNIGIAFQINDDLKNFLTDDKLKPYLDDVENGIYTAPIILAGNTENITIGIEKTKILLNNYLVKVIDCVKTLPQNFYRQQLEELLKND